MSLLGAVARIFVKYAGNAAFCGFGGDVLIELWDQWNKSTPDEKLKLAEVEKIAGQAALETRQQAQRIATEVAGDKPENVRQELTIFLTQFPATVRCSLKRPGDPTGKTVPPGTGLRHAEDLRKFLPTKLARFKPKDTPLQGVDWELEELLGVGGFGEVWKARNPEFAGVAPVALKFCLDKEIAGALRYEAGILNQVMSQGKHPGIVRLQHSYLRSDPPCLEYEYVAGGDLTGLIHDWHSSPGGCDWRKVAEVMAQLADIVGFAHKLPTPIVHRDLKPANVLVQRNGDGGIQLKVTDFGIGGIVASQAIKEASDNSAWYLTSMATGTCTPLYASPQQKRGMPADPRDDVFAMGAIWYQALTGNLSDGAPSGAAWRKKLSERGMPEDLVKLLESCIEEDSGERPSSGAELASRLKVFINPSIKIPCPQCRTVLKLSASLTAGKKVRCPKCNVVFTPDSNPVIDRKLAGAFQKELDEALAEMQTKGSANKYFAQHGPGRVAVWEDAARQGDAVAQWLLACCLQEGAGVEKDRDAAVSWLQRAAEGGLAVAQNELGNFYYWGDGGLEADLSEVVRLYTVAADQGFIEAQINLGDCYLEGEGVDQDSAEAARRYRKAAEAGWARGQDEVANCYFEGTGVEEDYPQAINFYRKAAEQGYANAQLNLANCYASGKGVKKNWSEAAKWYRKAAEQGMDYGQFGLGNCYEHGLGVEEDVAQAEQWYRKAADQGLRRAKNALARLGDDESEDESEPDDSDGATSYYVLNTNYRNNPADHEDILKHGKAAAYFDPWKYKIENLSKGDVVFLYQSGVGIVAMGYSSGKLERAPYHGDPEKADEEYFMTLDQFKRIEPPLTAAEIKEVTETNYVFLSTMFSMEAENALALIEHIKKEKRSE